MNRQEFKKQLEIVIKKFNCSLFAIEIKNDWYGERRKYFVDTVYGRLYFTVIDQTFLPMRIHETFDRTSIDQYFGVKPSKNGLWNIYSEDAELVLKEFELRLDVLTYKGLGIEKAA